MDQIILFPTTVSAADFVELTLLVVSFGAEEFVQRLVDDLPVDGIHCRTSRHAVRDVTADRLADIVVEFSQICVVFLEQQLKEYQGVENHFGGSSISPCANLV